MDRFNNAARRLKLKIDADEKTTREAECTKEIDEIYTTKNTNQAEYDRQLLTLSSGFLALSLAFIKDVVPTEQAIHRWLLYSSFIVLSVCVLLVLASFQISNLCLEMAKKHWERRKLGDLQAEFPYGAAKLIDLWNLGCGLVFVVGIILTVSFVIVNLNREATNGRQLDSRTRGAAHSGSVSQRSSSQGSNNEGPAAAATSSTANSSSSPKEIEQPKR